MLKLGLKPVQSSTIEKIGYVDGVLNVQFSGTPLFYYTYQGVPEKLYDLLVSVDDANAVLTNTEVSLGSLFHFAIKAHPEKYPFVKHPLPVKGN